MDPLHEIRAQRLLPVLRTAEPVESLISAGCRVIELTTSISGWADVLADVRERVIAGVGTVATAEQARLALDAGAAFLVSPYPAPGVREVARRRGAVFIEGGFTPAEVAAAAGRGAAKLFPAHVGGISYLRSLRAVLPDAVIIPTGGIAPADAPAWLDAGAAAVGIGSGLPADPAELAALFAGGRE